MRLYQCLIMANLIKIIDFSLFLNGVDDICYLFAKSNS